jgi:CelD/BcsL family acetyltransferase involved in cellulose biosynthesis
MRIPVSPFGAPARLELAYEAVPETAIADLQDWDISRVSKNRKRDLNRARRSELTVVDAITANDGARLFELYLETLRRNRGTVRYNAEYFGRLVELASTHENLRVLLAKRDQAIAAFVVVARQGATACYLHGATDWSMRDYRPTAVLFNDAIEWAKTAGCQCFNFMSSPKDQPSLTQYKEKWGAETREHRTYSLPLRSSYPVFRMAERIYRALGR